MKVRGALVVLALVGSVGLTACADTAAKSGATVSQSEAATRTAQGPFTLTIGPASGTKNLPISTEIDTRVTGGKVSTVTLNDDRGKAIAGAMRDDGTSWVPAQPLEFGRTYLATVTATGANGESQTKATSFTTMAPPKGTRVGSGLYLFTGVTYGAAMPVVVEFESDIPSSARASVERRLFVRSDPPQSGRWQWFGARQVLYRPADYWKPGTTLTVRSALAGHPIGKRYGDMDRSAVAKIADRQIVLDVDNATKKMTVYKDGHVIRTLPVSLGKKSTPSSSGQMVIMEKSERTLFDTTDTDGPNGYRIWIEYAQRLTWGGEFLHSAPWSVHDQGVRNVSHGCVNVSPTNAVWLYQLTLVGDPVIVRGTERTLQPGNGWTAWNVPWHRYGAGELLRRGVRAAV
jgi:lipoprotein-anchoring transpeptidase ErfK/SrfK